MSNLFTVGIGDACIIKIPDVLVTYALGSCVGVCLYDFRNHIAGMVHILLPSRHDIQNSNEYKFADSGISKLLEQMLQQGANKKSIVAKIAGGAEMFSTYGLQSSGIGLKNVEAVIKVLKTAGIPIVAQDTGKNFGRSIWFKAKDGSLEVKTVNHGTYVI